MNSACNFFLKKTPTQMVSCEYCKIFKNTYFEEHLRTAVRILRKISFWKMKKWKIENSEKLEISKISEFSYFQVFHIGCRTEKIYGFKNLGKRFPRSRSFQPGRQKTVISKLLWFRIHPVFIQLYVDILIHLNLLDYCTALDSHIWVASNLIS